MKINRRDSLKTIMLTGAGAGLILTACHPTPEEKGAESVDVEPPVYGRTPEEKELDQELRDSQFFNTHEMATLMVLCDLIIPKDEFSGSATEAGVPDFIEFMMKDYPPFQNVLRGGLMWIDHQARELADKPFKDLSNSQQIQILDRVAYPDEAIPEDAHGVKFFNQLRDLTATGFYTTKMGFEDLDYQGNIANVWDGIPDEVMQKHGFTYDEKYLDLYVRPEDRSTIIEWDEKGDIIN